LGDHIFNKYLEAKEKEWESYNSDVHHWELDSYLSSF
jgi:glutamine synthetase